MAKFLSSGNNIKIRQLPLSHQGELSHSRLIDPPSDGKDFYKQALFYTNRMNGKKKQVSFYVDIELWKLFSKVCIDLERAKTSMLEELISRFVKKK